MIKILSLLMAFILVLMLGACGNTDPAETENPNVSAEGENAADVSENAAENATEIVLSENSITVDGKPAEEAEGITLGGEIIYYHEIETYESGNPYGEGSEDDMHSEEEAAAHTLLTVTEPGTYVISGSMKGQIAVDLGEEAETDPEAKVTLILDGAEITCEVAPSIIFYNVYECGDPEKIDEAGATVVIADKSVNYINGSYVAKIYKDNDEEKKLHKYDGALYSKMSMNVKGEAEGSGILNIYAENEGLCSELHLTLNGGNVLIAAQDDGINANEDGISVITVNGGSLDVKGGLGSEGDGIDSNGQIIINGGAVIAAGNGRTGDGGVDADMGITMTGGSLVAFGSRNDNVKAEGKVTCVRLSFSSVRKGGSLVEFVDETGYGMMAESSREFQSVVFAGENLEKNKVYRLYVDNVLQEYSGEGNDIMPGMNPMGGDFGRGEMNENFMSMPDGFSEWLDSANDIPEDIKEWLEYMESLSEEYSEKIPRNINEGQPSMQMPGSFGEAPEKPDGNNNENPVGMLELNVSYPTEFVITDELYSFYGIADSAESTDEERVSFTVNGKDKLENYDEGSFYGIKSVECSRDIGNENIQLTVVYTGDDEEKQLSESILLSDGYEKINEIFSGLENGGYRLTVAVLSENGDYTGSTSFDFYVGLK